MDSEKSIFDVQYVKVSETETQNAVSGAELKRTREANVDDVILPTIDMARYGAGKPYRKVIRAKIIK